MLGAQLAAEPYLQRLQQEVEQIDRDAMGRWSDLIFSAWEQGNFVFIIGNGFLFTSLSQSKEEINIGHSFAVVFLEK